MRGQGVVLGFLNINGDIAVKEPEGLSMARAQKLNNKAVYDFFFYLCEICARHSISVTNHALFSIWMRQGFLLIMFLRILSPQKVLKFCKFHQCLKGLHSDCRCM